jgi:hypothetical protein
MLIWSEYQDDTHLSFSWSYLCDISCRFPDDISYRLLFAADREILELFIMKEKRKNKLPWLLIDTSSNMTYLYIRTRGSKKCIFSYFCVCIDKLNCLFIDSLKIIVFQLNSIFEFKTVNYKIVSVLQKCNYRLIIKNAVFQSKTIGYKIVIYITNL